MPLQRRGGLGLPAGPPYHAHSWGICADPPKLPRSIRPRVAAAWVVGRPNKIGRRFFGGVCGLETGRRQVSWSIQAVLCGGEIAMKRRTKTPPETQADVLASCRRRCCICYALQKDQQEKKGQIAHLDGDPSNHDVDNLV
jgi:hypothetical protein